MQPIEIFFSYSHKDEALCEQLAQHLRILERQAIINSWHDRKILAGEEWDRKISNHLETAQIILLLVSADFVASEYCYGVEVKRAIERHEAGEANVIPVILRPVDWTGTPFSKLQALPKDAKPVTTWPNQDEAFVNIAQGIRAAVEKLVQIRREKLYEYEIKFSEAIQREYPIINADVSELQRLQKTLELKEEDVIPIQERSTTPIRQSRQKSLRYRQEVQHLADKDGGDISALSRSILNALQVNLGLSSSEVNLIEEEILKPFSTKKENLKQYEQGFSEAIKKGYPILDSDRESLKRLQQILTLTDDDAMSVEEIITSQILSTSTQVSSTSTQDDDLSSDLKIDYTQLRDLLRSAKWKEADTETYLIMLKAVNREPGDWIRNEELKKLPCKELRTIDRLWKKYSNDRFGFSIQKQIYEKIQGKPGTYDHLVFQKFGDHVGWRVNSEWLLYDKLTFNLTAPEGHLPGWFGGLNLATLFLRVKNCKL